jgi:hypothetical protein
MAEDRMEVEIRTHAEETIPMLEEEIHMHVLSNNLTTTTKFEGANGRI